MLNTTILTTLDAQLICLYNTNGTKIKLNVFRYVIANTSYLPTLLSGYEATWKSKLNIVRDNFANCKRSISCSNIINNSDQYIEGIVTLKT